MSRIIIFTGKGGVGKTSVAAAHARKAALSNKKTLLVSADMAHNLSDLFEISIGKEITTITDYLDALEIDPYFEMEHNFAFMMDAISKLLHSDGVMKSISIKEDIMDFSMFPGMEELFSLLRIQQIYDSNLYDIIIVDCAPTGETLSLLKFPELFSWYMEKLFPIGKIGIKILRPIGKQLFKIELPDKKAMNDIEKLFLKLLELQLLLKNREVCSIRLVAMPEKMVVEETKKNYMYLNLYNFNVDGLFINRVLPKDADAPFFKEWRQLQKSYIDELTHVFGNIPISNIKWYDTEINGMASLDRLLTDTLTEDDLLTVRNAIMNEIYEKNEKGYMLTVNLPFVKKEEIDLHEAGQDLLIKIGNFKRNIPLPDTLRNYEIISAKMMESQLVIQYVKKRGDAEYEQ